MSYPVETAVITVETFVAVAADVLVGLVFVVGTVELVVTDSEISVDGSPIEL